MIRSAKLLGSSALLLLLVFLPYHAHALDATINQVSLSWSPSTVVITPGDQVTWVWSSGSHTVTSGTGPTDPNVGMLFDVPLDGSNTTFSFTFTTTGTFPFFCRPHFGFGMVGEVIVEADDDGDGIPNSQDNCPSNANTAQDDADADGTGDACDTCTDTDGDGFGDPGFPANTCNEDNCPSTANPGQEDADSDGIGDVCDTCTDTDGDGFGDPGFPANTCAEDNCPSTSNPSQADSDGDGVGDACETNCDCPFEGGDINGDGFTDAVDLNLAINIYFFNQTDTQDPLCPVTRADMNGDGFSDAVDLNLAIGLYFFNGPPGCDPCPDAPPQEQTLCP